MVVLHYLWLLIALALVLTLIGTYVLMAHEAYRRERYRRRHRLAERERRQAEQAVARLRIVEPMAAYQMLGRRYDR